MSWNFVGKETLAQLFSYEFCEMFKNTIFTEHCQTTASEYRNNMPIVFRTKYEKNESNDIRITYHCIYMWLNYNTSIHQTTTACKNKAKPYQFLSNHKAKVVTFFIWSRGASENLFEVKHIVHVKFWFQLLQKKSDFICLTQVSCLFSIPCWW